MKNLAIFIFLTLFSTVCHVVASAFPVQVIEESSVVISIPTDDEFYIGKRRVTRAEIAPEVDKLLRDLPPEKRRPYVKAAREVKYGTIISIRDDLRSLGYEEIALVSDKRRKSNRNSTTKTRVAEKGASEAPMLGTSTGNKLFVATVATRRNGTMIIKVGGTQVPLSGLAKQVRSLLNSRVFKGMILEAPGAIHYGSIVQVIDELKAGGAEEIGLGLIK